jgi:CRISPR type IV-associated protein Csf3
MNFQPLKITAILQTPVITDGFLPLDGILYHTFIRDLFGAQHKSEARKSNVPEWSGKVLPIERYNLESGREWFYACSFAQWPENAVPEKHNYAKRFRTGLATKYVEFGNKKGKVDTSRGEYKNMFQTDYAISSPYVSWYLVGDEKQIKLLLPFLTHLGKKYDQGCGSVLSWKIEPWHSNWSVEDNNGKLMRAVPSADGDTLYGIRPSYWEPKHQFRCHMPKVSIFDLQYA